MTKLLKKLLKLALFLGVVALAGCVFFYINRKEHFTCFADFKEELLATLAEFPMVALLIP